MRSRAFASRWRACSGAPRPPRYSVPTERLRSRRTLFLLDNVKGQLLVLLAGDGSAHALQVVGIDAQLFALAAGRNVELPLVDQVDATATIDVGDLAIDRGALQGVTGGGVAEIYMPRLVQWQLEPAPAVENYFDFVVGQVLTTANS